MFSYNNDNVLIYCDRKQGIPLTYSAASYTYMHFADTYTKACELLRQYRGRNIWIDMSYALNGINTGMDVINYILENDIHAYVVVHGDGKGEAEMRAACAKYRLCGRA